MAVRRPTRGSNKNDVPSAAVRRELKCWMLGTMGDGITVDCALCGKPLLYSQITKDRYPIPGRRGGRYVKGNIRPMCLSCNAADGAREAAREKREAKAKREARLARRREAYRLRKAG